MGATTTFSSITVTSFCPTSLPHVRHLAGRERRVAAHAHHVNHFHCGTTATRRTPWTAFTSPSCFNAFLSHLWCGSGCHPCRRSRHRGIRRFASPPPRPRARDDRHMPHICGGCRRRRRLGTASGCRRTQPPSPASGLPPLSRLFSECTPFT